MFPHIKRILSSQQQKLLKARSKAPILTRFRLDTEDIRSKTWSCAKTPSALHKRWVELTGPGNDPKMVINAMNSRANGYMLDLEDSMAPTPANIRQAHDNISAVVRGDLTVTTASKRYALSAHPEPTFMVRVRGLHMPHDGTIYDVCEFIGRNGRELYDSGRGPFLYIPKLETYEEAAFVDLLLKECEEYAGLPENSVKVTVLIETFPAIFQTEEIAYALRGRLTGFNCGRWDYLFSMMKCLPNEVFPDRSLLTMSMPFMEAYVRQIVRTAHKRGVHAMGGMSAFIPSKHAAENEEILLRIKDDKMLEICRGCDGAWVAHPGLIEPVQALFREHLSGNPHQKDKLPEPVDATDLYPSHFPLEHTRACFQNNIKVATKYTEEWLKGNGAVAIDGLMEDLATAEIAIAQLRNWSKFNVFRPKDIVFDGDARTNYILNDYLHSNSGFLEQSARSALETDNGFRRIEFPGPFVETPKTGVELTRERGSFLKDYLSKHPSYGFLGTSNGVSAVNVVAGGGGRVGPYAGGWQGNAMKNRLGMLLPDTLHVAPEECAATASEFNEHLYRAKLVQADAGFDDVDYDSVAVLADLEQGWNTPEKTRIAVRKAVEAGINVIHIEDQGDKKRCGHLGDKELNSYEDYALIMRSANLAAREMGVQDAVTFVARTDAYSAKRIHYSANLTSYSHPEHKFIDWDRGTSPDGKYLYLKDGINPDTGRRWGLELSIYRGASIVSDGLASHVWMETPDADLQVAKDFMDGVNELLAPEGKRAWGLYNHSPSFDWDVKFFAEAIPLANAIIEDVLRNMHGYGNSMLDDWKHQNPMLSTQYHNSFRDIIRNALVRHGTAVNGDLTFSDKAVADMIPHIIDATMSEDEWRAQFHEEKYTKANNGLEAGLKATKDRIRLEGFKPNERIADIIVDERLRQFGPQLASFGYNMHLITLPEFHVTAYRMHSLAKDFQTTGIQAFVTSTQRPERQLSNIDPTYTYYKHQTATGTGVEAAFNRAVGSSDVNTLADSTETDDIKKRT